MDRLINVIENVSARREIYISSNAPITIVESKSDVALVILNQIREQTPMTSDIYFFVVKLFRDNFIIDFFIKRVEDILLTFLEKKYEQSVQGIRNMCSL